MNFKNIRQLAKTNTFILGSSSPRRKRILTELGIEFKQVTPHINEDIKSGEQPFDYAMRLAEEKALNAADGTGLDEIVLGCDTIVLLEDNDHPGRILGKPATEKEALETLSLLNANSHIVATALALVRGGNIISSDYEKSRVFFNRVTEKQLKDYIATGEPMDKAGAYGIQGMGAFLVDRFEGNLDNIIGLPCYLLDEMARLALEKINTTD